MKSGKKNIAVGDRLLLVWNSRRNTIWVTVVKVGRRWVYLDNRYRMDRQTMRLDGGTDTSPGRCYHTETDYEEDQELRILFIEFLRKVGYVANDGVTAEDVREAARLLKLEL